MEKRPDLGMTQFHIFKNIFVSESCFHALFIVVLTSEDRIYFYALVSMHREH
jgi:hypothetical protein